MAGDRFHTLEGVQGLLWALGDLWKEPGLSGLLCGGGGSLSLLPPYELQPLPAPFQVPFCLSSPTRFGTIGHLPLAPLSPCLCPTPHVRPSPASLLAEGDRPSPLKSNLTAEPWLLQVHSPNS